MLALTQHRSDQLGAAEVADDAGAGEIGAAQVGRLDDRREEAGALEVGLPKIRAPEHAAVQVRAAQVHPGRDGVREIAGEQVGAAEIGVGQAGAGECGPPKVEAPQVEPAQVHAGEVGRRIALAGREPRLELGRVEADGRRVDRRTQRAPIGGGGRRGRHDGGQQVGQDHAHLSEVTRLRAGWPTPGGRPGSGGPATGVPAKAGPHLRGPALPCGSCRSVLAAHPCRFTAGRPGAILASLLAFT